MPVTVRIPSALRHLSGGKAKIEASPGSISEVVSTVADVRHRVLDDQGRLRTHVNLFVNGSHIRDLSGLETQLTDGDELVILPAVSGG